MGSAVEEAKAGASASVGDGLGFKQHDRRTHAFCSDRQRPATASSRSATAEASKSDDDVVNKQHGAEEEASATEAPRGERFGRFDRV